MPSKLWEDVQSLSKTGLCAPGKFSCRARNHQFVKIKETLDEGVLNDTEERNQKIAGEKGTREITANIGQDV